MLTVLRYIELNPVHARMVALPTEYRWSSVHTHLGHAKSKLITSHEVNLHLDCHVVEQASVYAKWLHAVLAREADYAIFLHVMQERGLGA